MNSDFLLVLEICSYTLFEITANVANTKALLTILVLAIEPTI